MDYGEIKDMTALELASKIKNKEIGVAEATKAVLGHIRKKDGELNCFINVLEKKAIKQAEEVQAGINSGEIDSPLAGVPMAVKDNICTKDILTTCGSRMLENFKPAYNATVVKRLFAAGVVNLGKLNMDEFGMGSTTETSFFGKAKNPWDTDKSPGGSSGGAAAAVAAREAFFTVGSDTGGSIRQPCSYCGVTGIKPTYGRVSRYGLIAYASSMDQIGPIAGTAEECKIILKLIEGHDEKDSTSVHFEVRKGTHIKTGDLPLRGLRIGILEDFLGGRLNPDVKNSILEGAKVLESLGAELEFFKMPYIEYAVPAYYIIALSEAGSNLARYDGIKYGFRAEGFNDLNEMYLKTRSRGFGREVKRRIMLGAFALSSGYYDAYYKKASQVRRLIKQSFDITFEKYDIILGPTAHETAPKLGESLKDPLKMYTSDVYTVPANLAGLPALTMPCGFDRDGMPIGMQLTGKAFDDTLLLDVAIEYQKETEFHKRRPE